MTERKYKTRYCLLIIYLTFYSKQIPCETILLKVFVNFLKHSWNSYFVIVSKITIEAFWMSEITLKHFLSIANFSFGNSQKSHGTKYRGEHHNTFLAKKSHTILLLYAGALSCPCSKCSDQTQRSRPSNSSKHVIVYVCCRSSGINSLWIIPLEPKKTASIVLIRLFCIHIFSYF